MPYLKIQKLAREWGIGFLEDDNNIVAVGVDDGIERALLLESNEVVEELLGGLSTLEKIVELKTMGVDGIIVNDPALFHES